MRAIEILQRKALVLACLAAVSGCSDFSVEYGPTTGHAGRTSLNGFGALRSTFEQAGADSHDVNRLSRRVARNDVIVWIPTQLDTVPTDVGRWFDRWLGRGGHTLVYIVPDSGSEVAYWRSATPLAPPEQRLEYRRRAARGTGRRLAERLNRSSVRVHDWFDIKPLESLAPAAPLGGPWVEQRSVAARPPVRVAGESPPPSGGSATPLEVAFEITAADEAASAGDAPPPAAATGGQPPPKRPSARPTDTPSDSVELKPLLRSRGGELIVGQITSPGWRDSKILVVSGGSLLTNFAFTQPWNRQLAAQLATASPTASSDSFHAGFLTSDRRHIPVSEAEAGPPQASGMELLTVWPISLVTMHGVILGLIACLMLMPIFGRPRHLRHRHQGRFGDHLDAVAALMNKAGGEAFARLRISQYLRRVRGETSGPWVLPEAGPGTAGQSRSDEPAKPAREPVE